MPLSQLLLLLLLRHLSSHSMTKGKGLDPVVGKYFLFSTLSKISQCAGLQLVDDAIVSRTSRRKQELVVTGMISYARR